MHSNVVTLQFAAETARRPLPLTSVSPGLQRAVVTWADFRSRKDGFSVLHLIEQPALMTEHSLLYQHDGVTLVSRFVGNRVSSLHRSIADELLLAGLPSTPTAHSHSFTTDSGMYSVVLPFVEYGGFAIVLFENGRSTGTA